MDVEAKLVELGIVLPGAARAVGCYVPAVLAGGVVYVSGQLPMRNGELMYTGKVGADLGVEQAQEAARQAVINALAAARTTTETLNRIVRVLRLEVYVNSGEGFTQQSQVANGASELLQAVFGPAGRHSRLAVGVAELSLDAPVELALMLQVD